MDACLSSGAPGAQRAAGGLAVGFVSAGAPLRVRAGWWLRRALLHVHGRRRPRRPTRQSRLAQRVRAVGRGAAPQGPLDRKRSGEASGRPSPEYLYLPRGQTFRLVAGTAALDAARIVGGALARDGPQFITQVAQVAATGIEADRRAALRWQPIKSMRWSWSAVRGPGC